MQVTFKLSDQIARPWGETADVVGRHLMEDAATEKYRNGKLSHRQVAAALGLDYWQTEAFLKQRAVLANYSTSDLAADNSTLERILPRL